MFMGPISERNLRLSLRSRASTIGMKIPISGRRKSGREIAWN